MAASDFVSYFLNHSAVQRVTKSRTSAELLRYKDHCLEHGVTNEEIVKLLGVATSEIFDETASCELVWCLLPSEVVTDDVVVFALSRICSKKGPPSVQAKILDWLLLVCDWLPSTEVLAQQYGVIFQCLSHGYLLPSACHLLFKITGSSNVTKYRVNKLISLQGQAVTQCDKVAALLGIYKLLRPDLVDVDAWTDDGKIWHAFCLTSTQAVWSGIISKVLLDTSPDAQTETGAESGRPPQDNPMELGMPSAKVQAESAWIRSHCFQQDRCHGHIDTDNEQGTKRKHASNDTPYLCDSGVHPDSGIAEDMSTLRPGAFSPPQPMMQNLCSSKSPMRSPCCVSNGRDRVWRLQTLALMQNSFHSEFLLKSASSSSELLHCNQLLRTAVRLTDFLMEPLAVVEEFLEEYVSTWDGTSHQQDILALLSHVRLRPFADLEQCYLDAMERLYRVSPPLDKAKFIDCWRKMFCNFVRLERHRQCHQEVDGSREDTSHEEGLAGSSSLHCTSLNSGDAIARFLAAADEWFFFGLTVHDDHPVVQQAVLRFFFDVEHLFSKADNVNFIPFPSPNVSARLLLSRNAAAVSDLCLLFSRLYMSIKQSIRNACAASTKHEWCVVAKWQETAKVTQVFNRIVLDIAAMLYKGTLFVSGRGPSVFQLPWASATSLQTHQPPGDALSVCHGINFLALFCDFQRKRTAGTGVKRNEEVAYGQGADMINARTAFVEFLKSKHFEGIAEFQKVFLPPSNC